jgi:Ca2+-binding EF-hand superfamily protein
MATRIALALLCALTTSFTPPTPRRTEVKLRKTRGAGGDLVDPDAGAPDDDAMTELRERMMQEELKQRKQTIKEGKGNRLSAQYVELLTAQHPSELVGAFYREADPRVQVAIQDAIMGMLGAGAVDIEFTTTGSRIAELCFRLQMTGYMLRNAEYVLALQDVLKLAPTGRTPAQLRAAFSRVDTDNSGYIDADEVQNLFDDVYGDLPDTASTAEINDLKQRKKADVESFVRFFDANSDGKISFAEFCRALGGADASPAQQALDKFSDGAKLLEAPSTPTPITGELKVGDRTVEASDYVAELKQEAARLKNELATYAQSSGQNSLAAIGQYIASIDPEQRDLLVSKMTPEAREAAAELVNYVLKDSSPEGAGQKLEPDQQVTMERRILDQICRWQIVVGYRLRELEASGEARRRLG